MKETQILGSSMHDSKGMLVNGYLAQKVKFDNNVFYNGKKFHMQVLDSKEWTITNNLFIGCRERPPLDNGLWDPTAFIHMYTPYLPSRDNHKVEYNVGQGSEGIGYAFPATPCEEKEQVQFKYNEVGHCKYSGVLFNLKENKCYHIGYVSVHDAVDGVTFNSNNADDGYDANQLIVAECKTNIILHTGSSAIVHNNFLKNAWVSALARPTCTDCYTS